MSELENSSVEKLQNRTNLVRYRLFPAIQNRRREWRHVVCSQWRHRLVRHLFSAACLVSADSDEEDLSPDSAMTRAQQITMQNANAKYSVLGVCTLQEHYV